MGATPSRWTVRGWSVAFALLALTIVPLLVAGCGDDGEETTTAAESAETPDFTYSGKEGPKHWAELDKSFKLCDHGDHQSPIDLAGAEKGSPPPVSFDYLEEEVELENNGHSVEAGFEPGSAVEIGGTDYELLQFHFHSASEHLSEGKSHPLEFHFVNEAADGSLAVFGVFADQGRENPAFHNLAENLPSDEGDVEPAGAVDIEALLPEDPEDADRWTYHGSLTTPPCTEGVDWFVFTDPIELSSAQIAAYKDVYPDNHSPVQPLDGRTLIVGN